jgi:hypothetical protein
MAGGHHPTAGRGAGRSFGLAFAPRNPEHARLLLTAKPERGRREAGDGPPVPEAWVGRAVRLVFVSGASTEHADGVLEEVNDRGIIMSVETHVGQPAQPLFYPWGAVIQLSEARER